MHVSQSETSDVRETHSCIMFIGLSFTFAPSRERDIARYRFVRTNGGKKIHRLASFIYSRRTRCIELRAKGARQSLKTKSRACSRRCGFDKQRDGDALANVASDRVTWSARIRRSSAVVGRHRLAWTRMDHVISHLAELSDERALSSAITEWSIRER
jgi:hypothetical protein